MYNFKRHLKYILFYDQYLNIQILIIWYLTLEGIDLGRLEFSDDIRIAYW